jgi:hypothetical protein
LESKIRAETFGAEMSEMNDENPLQELLNDVISSLEPLEARSYAIYEFLRAKGIAADEDFAPFLEQAANASNVRWRAFRVRAESLLASAVRSLDKEFQANERRAEKAEQEEWQETPESVHNNNTMESDPAAEKQSGADGDGDSKSEAKVNGSQTPEPETWSQKEKPAASDRETPQGRPKEIKIDEPGGRENSTADEQPIQTGTKKDAA